MKDITQRIHGSYRGAVEMANIVAGNILSKKSAFPPQNPITKTGGKVLESMQKQYGEKKGKQVFYASINKGVKGSKKWHGKS